MILRELKLSDEAAFNHMIDLWEDSPGFNMLYGLIAGLSFSSFLKIMEEAKQGIGLTGDQVPATGLYAFVGDEIVGKVSVRHRLNKNLENVGGHVGYGVVGIHRKKGYASQMLKEALVYCRTLGLEKVLVTCDEINLASKKVIEKNGGVFENTYDSKNGTARKLRYWIPLTSQSS